MEDQRAKTFEALESFIQSQSALLAKTESDIARLQQLRNNAISQPAHFMKTLDQELAGNTFRLIQNEVQENYPANIDWSVYDAHDPKALQNLALNTQQKYEQRNKPFRYQRSELSDLQKLVKDARRTIVDPVLTIFESMSEPEDEQEKISPEDIRRESEREKIRQLKNRRIHSLSGLRLPSGVLVRRDVEDENIDVDVIQDDPSILDYRIGLPTGTQVLTAPIVSSLPNSVPQSLRFSKSQRNRKPSRKAEAQHEGNNITPRTGKRNGGVSSPVENEVSHNLASENAKPRGPDKPKSGTYKQAWSVSEQNLLEQLLEQIPDGEKNRWQKISRAMNGKRTPRQVASRVQKYFEKLKRFGLDEG